MSKESFFMEKPRVDFLVQWQSLVAPPYRTIWRQLQNHAGWRVTMIAPEKFREGGMQELLCAPNDERNPPLITLPVKRWHTQVVWFQGLSAQLIKWLKTPAQKKLFLCFAEPYAVTALFGWLSLVMARFFSFSRSSRPLFLLFAFQNIYKHFPWPIRLVQSLMFRVCDAIFVPGVEHEDVLRKHGYRGRCIRFPMWVDESLYYSASKSNDAKVRIGYAGSFLPEKGITQVLDALLKHPEAIQDCAFDIAGGGQLRDEIVVKVDQLKHVGVDANFLGSVAIEKMPDFYRSLDLLIVPSLTASHWKEQFGRVIIEAMACGCLVIGSNSGEIPFVIADERRIFPEGNMTAMLTVMQRALLDIKGERHLIREQVSAIASKKYADYNVASALAASLET
jgi:glycosyltransferase involved in cell wall biosynthesis